MTPVIWTGADRLVPHSEIRLMGTVCGGEVAVGDSLIDGVWLYDAGSGNSYVGTPIIDYVKDSFACADKAVFGIPAYGAAPGCHADGQFPDRQMAFIRPAESSIGSLYAHLKSCCGVSGTAAEMTPVEIVPAAMPSPAPGGLQYLTAVVTEGTNCDSRKFQWYWGSGIPSVTGDSLTIYSDLPTRAWTADDDVTFGLAIWVKQTDGTWLLEKVSNAIFQSYISKFVYRANYLTPRTIIANQESPSTYNYTFNIDLRAQPNYSDDATEVQLWVESNLVSPASGGEAWGLYVDVNGVRKYRTGGVPATYGNLETGEIHVPIPVNKILSIDYVKETVASGTNYNYNASRVTVFLEAFK